MKPETHLITGGLIGLMLTKSEPLLPLTLVLGATVIGAGMPDVPILAQVLADKRAGRKLFSTESRGTMWYVLKDISHSPLWFIFGLSIASMIQDVLLRKIVLGFTLGYFSHWILDALTHCGEAFKATDQTLLWPFVDHNSPPLGYMLKQMTGAGWEYRYNYMNPNETRAGATKPPERVFQIICVALIIMSIIW